MASVRNLKRDLNFVFGDIIEAAYILQLSNPEINVEETEKIIDDAISFFDDAIIAVNTKSVDNKKVHYSSLKNTVEEQANGLVDRLNNL